MGLLNFFKRKLQVADYTPHDYLTGWDKHPVIRRQRLEDYAFGGGGIGMNRLTRPAGTIMLKQYRYWCDCGEPLTDGPCGGAAINAVCKKCMLNYGCLPGFD